MFTRVGTPQNVKIDYATEKSFDYLHAKPKLKLEKYSPRANNVFPKTSRPKMVKCDYYK